MTGTEPQRSREPFAAGTKTLKVGGRTYVLGLHWLTTDTPNRVNATARKLAKDYDADLFTARNTDERMAQYAIIKSDRKSGLRSGAMSAAAALAMLEPEGGKIDNWLAAFDTDFGTWVFEMRGGNILVGGDRLFSDRTAAQRYVANRYRDLGGWQRLTAPSTWAAIDEFSNAEPDDLGALLALKDARGSLVRDTNPIKQKLPVIIATTLALVMTIGGTLYMRNSIADRQREEARRRVQEQLAQEQLQRDREPERYETPDYWTLEPEPFEKLAACIAGFEKIPQIVPGWSLEAIDCHDRNVRANYRSTFGTALGTRAWLDDKYADQISYRVDDEKKLLEITAPRPQIDERGDKPLHGNDEMREYLEALRVATRTQMELQRTRGVNPPPNIDLEEWEPPEWKRFGIQLQTSHPESWRETFTAMSGFVLEDVRFLARDQTYVLRGQVYVD